MTQDPTAAHGKPTDDTMTASPEPPSAVESFLNGLRGLSINVMQVDTEDLLRMIGLPVPEPDPSTAKGRMKIIEKMLNEASGHRDHLTHLMNFYDQSATKHGIEEAATRRDELKAWIEGWMYNTLTPIIDALRECADIPNDDPRTLTILSAVQDAMTGYLGAVRTVRETLDDRHRAVTCAMPIDTVLNTASNQPPEDPITLDLSSPPAPSGASTEEQDSGPVPFEPPTE